MPGLAVLILAAGRSSRLSGFKPLAPLGGTTLLGLAAELSRAAGVGKSLVVAGFRAGEVLGECARLGLDAVVNPDPDQGMFSSVRTGLVALPRDLEGVFVLPVDIPLVRPWVLRRMAEALPRSPAQALVPAFGGRRGHPPLLGPGAVETALAWDGTGGLRGVLARLEVEALEVACADVLFDVDTDADLARARVLWERRGVPRPEEARVLLDRHRAGARGLAHATGVARAALAMARALAPAGTRAADRTGPGLASGPLDLELLESAALLHDLAKGLPDHEQAGARLLEDLGFVRAAPIVAAHRDIDPAGVERLAERELVYLADKLVRGSQRVTVRQRFQDKLDRFALDPEATTAIRRRLAHALAMQERMEQAAGRSLDSILDADQDEHGPWT